jgi:Flp pilus assembly pilin Flp
MKQLLVRFLREEEGQDLIEYTLLLGFVAMASAALFIGSGAATKNIWGIANAEISNAAAAAS